MWPQRQPASSDPKRRSRAEPPLKSFPISPPRVGFLLPRKSRDDRREVNRVYSPHAADSRHSRPEQDLCRRIRRAQRRQPRDRARRDLRVAGSQRCGQDHTDQHHLRHRQSDFRDGPRQWPRHRDRLSADARCHRPGAAGVTGRDFRVSLEDPIRRTSRRY